MIINKEQGRAFFYAGISFLIAGIFFLFLVGPLMCIKLFVTGLIFTLGGWAAMDDD